jgi:hypothetical protein
MDKIEQLQMQQATAAVNHSAAAHMLNEWQQGVKKQCTELTTYLIHLYAQQLNASMPDDQARQFCMYFMDTYVRWNGGQTFFKEMPDITKLLAGTNEPKEEDS